MLFIIITIILLLLFPHDANEGGSLHIQSFSMMFPISTPTVNYLARVQMWALY